MYNAFDKPKGKRILNRKLKTGAAERFSPSYGVHRGRIPDPNWPPSQFPDDGTAMKRKDRRVMCDFTILSGGKKYKVHGDLSRGGVMFFLPDLIRSTDVSVQFNKVVAKATIQSTSTQQKGVAHRAKFIDPEEGNEIWDALIHG